MSRSNNTEPSLRITLAKIQLFRAVGDENTKLDSPTIIDSEAGFTTCKGTPAKAHIAQYMRPSWMVAAAYKHGKQTAVKQRDIHTSPSQALALLGEAFNGSSQHGDVMALARTLLAIVEGKGLLRGYSAMCSAGACILGAEMALNKTLLTTEGGAAIGVEAKALLLAYVKLKGEMYKDLQVVGALIRANGNPNAFPGRPSISSKLKVSPPVKSQLTMLRDEMAARGGSALRTVVNADELPDRMSLRSGRYYAGQQQDNDDEMVFKFEDDAGREDEDEDEAVVLPRIRYASADDDRFNGRGHGHRHAHRHQRSLETPGTALGNHLTIQSALAR